MVDHTRYPPYINPVVQRGSAVGGLTSKKGQDPWNELDLKEGDNFCKITCISMHFTIAKQMLTELVRMQKRGKQGA
eukprot:1159483-Pelagomonas_calceolata.AAC.7